LALFAEGTVAQSQLGRIFVSCEFFLARTSPADVQYRRNLVNILLYVAEQCKRYYPVLEIPAMLETFNPILTKDVRVSLTSDT